ncbi:hypothetical protein GQ457_05G018500 [Hibiscus cannabinus]
MTKGMSRTETTGPSLAENLGWESDLGRANQDNIRENPSRIFSLVFAPTPLSPGFVDFAIWLASGRDVISRWDSRSNLDVSRRNQVVIFLRESCVLRYLRDPGNEGVRFLRSTIQSRRLGDQLVREFVSS